MSALHVREARPGFVAAWAPQVILYVWREEPTVEAIGVVAAMVEEMRSSTEAAVVLGLVEEGTPTPGNEAREALAALMQGSGGLAVASALVFEGRGFQSSMVRMVAAGLALLARQPYPHQVFADVPSATRWLERVHGAVSAAELRALMAEAREA